MSYVSSEFGVRSSEYFKLNRSPVSGSVSRRSHRLILRMEPALECHYRGNFLLRTSHGFSYIALLVAIVIIGISLGAAGKYWQNVMLREKEEELLFRGNQYRQAIERYYTAVPGRAQYPQNIDDLLKDSRTPAGKRHLRQKYTDPMTGEDFEIITALTVTAAVGIAAPQQTTAAPGIKGVHSKSEKEPLKKDNFPPGNENLAGKSTYSEWLFVAFTGTTPPAIHGQPVVSKPQTTAQPHHSQ